MAKIDKSLYTKSEWKLLKEQRRRDKEQQRLTQTPTQETTIPTSVRTNTNVAFVLGNGTSRKSLDPKEMQAYGKIYGCNALYRTFNPDFLVAVDVKMILEINKAGYQHNNVVWTNPNKSYRNIKNLNLFNPSKGWSSGPTALWLAAQHGYDKIFILGFDYKGLDNGTKLNNMYADTANYKKSTDGATFFGNWMRQTVAVIKEHPQIRFYRVIQPDNYCPEELNKFDNFRNITVGEFRNLYGFS
jgi:hypothetical protein